MTEFPFAVPSPLSDSIFKYGNTNRQSPAMGQWDAGAVTYIPERFESVRKTANGYLLTIQRGGKNEPEVIRLTEEEFGKRNLKTGNFTYFYGCPYPQKTVRPDVAIHAMMPVKRRFIDTMKLLVLKESLIPMIGFLLMGRKRQTRLIERALDFFNQEADMTIRPYYLDGYYCNVVREIQRFVSVFLSDIGISREVAEKTAEIVGMMVEYDNAYLFRVNDVLNEASEKDLMKDFPKETERLMKLEMERESEKTKYVGEKLQKAVLLWRWAWRLPRLKKAIKNGIMAMDFNECKLDASDIYYTLLYRDYDVGGKKVEERTAIYLAMYPDKTKAPYQIIIRNR